MTITLRLSLLFTVVVEILLVAFVGILYRTISADRREDFFEQLEAKSRTVADVFFNADELDKTALTRARQHFHTMLASSQVIILDSLNRCIYVNDSAYSLRSSLFEPIILTSAVFSFVSPAALQLARMKGIAKVEEAGIHAIYLLHPDDDKQYMIIVRAFDDAGAHLLSDVRIVLAVGCLFMPLAAFALGWWFSRNALAPVAAMTLAANEISPANLQARLPEGKNNDELGNLARAFNRVFERLERAYRAQRRFITHASHELRTPLTIMEGEIGVALLNDRDAESYRHTLESVQSTLLKLDTLTKNLLLLANIEANLSALPQKQAHFDEILYNTVDTACSLHPARTINVEDTTQGGEPCVVLCHRELLETALLNLLDNALKYSAPETVVCVTVERCVERYNAEGAGSLLHAGSVRCTIADEGIGITPEELPHIFSPFYRSERVHGVRGTGIGLALAQAIIVLHQGYIDVQSRAAARNEPSHQSSTTTQQHHHLVHLRRGTTMSVILPLAS